MLESGKPAAEQPGVTYQGTTNGDAVYEVGSGSYSFLATIVDATSVSGGVAGTVPATLALTLGTASLGTLTPGVARDYTTDLAATITSTAGDAALTVNDPSATATGHLVNGSFALAQPLLANGTAVGGDEQPDAAGELDGAGEQRPEDDHVQAVDRRQRGPADGQLQQDADLHAEHDYSLAGGPGGGASPVVVRISALATKCVAKASRSVKDRTWIHARSPSSEKIPTSSIGLGPEASR